VDMEQEWTVAHKNIHYKCGWSPFEGETFHSKVSHTWVNGKLAYRDGLFNEMVRGERLEFKNR
jgi:dihydroorotase